MSDDPLSRCAQELEFLQNKLDELTKECDNLKYRIGEASIFLADWDGYYDPATGKGNVKGLAEVIELAFKCLQGRSWR